MSSIDSLPEEVLLHIFRNFELKELGQCAKVSKKFRKICSDETLWPQKLNLDEKEVPSEFLEKAINHGVKYLSFSCAKLTGKLNFSVKENSVKYLNVSGSNSWGYKVNEVDLIDLVSSCHHLEKLSLGYLRLRNPSIIDSLLQNCQTLKVLDLFETQPSLQTIEKIVTKCDKLTEINFCFTKLKPESMTFICNNLTPTIQKLGLSHNSATDENIRTLVRRCHQITELDLQATDITNIAVTSIIENLFQTLVKVLLPDQIDVTKVLELGKSMPKLTYLWYYGPPSLNDPDLIDEIALNGLKKQLPHLSINTFSQPIAVPHVGEDDQFWEIQCKQLDQFPQNPDYVKHVEEMDKWMGGMGEDDYHDEIMDEINHLIEHGMFPPTGIDLGLEWD